MSWSFLSFLAEPWFVVPWYAVGVPGAVAVGWDLATINTPLKKAMSWAWPIIVLFFSVLGLALYFGTARAPGIGRLRSDEEKQHAHEQYEQAMWRRVNGAVIHCVAGDGLGIMTAMVIARAAGLSFWQEFWFEYLVGFLFGWLIFQLKSMRMMRDGLGAALLMAFRAEFFSMLTVMGGMGAVMAYVTPMTVTAQPKPLTYAFWGFGMLGLLVGFVFTYPMNWMMVRLGWKHGMGSREGAHPVESRAARGGLLTAMVALGIVALAIPATLVEMRQGRPLDVPEAAASAPPRPIDALRSGLAQDLDAAARALAEGRRTDAISALDAARRAATIAEAAAAGTALGAVLGDVQRARRALQDGDPQSARTHAAAGAERLRERVGPAATPDSWKSARLDGATVVDAHGVEVGEVTAVRGDRAELALGGGRDVWGFLDVGAARRIDVPVEALVPGPSSVVGPHLVAWPEASAEGSRRHARRRP